MATHSHSGAEVSGRPHSIDIALELEHQLAMEETDSLPPMSPTHAPGLPQSLDPQVLASIVLQLRESLAAMTKERDDLLALTSGYLDREATLKDALQHLTDKHTAVLEELNAAKQKAQDDAENISMLRAKVEESRRGLMRLQTENRRASVMSLDTARAGQAAHGPPSGRRPQFTPLTGQRGHGRGVSISGDTHIHSGSDDNTGGSPPQQSRRLSGFFARGPPSLETTEQPSDPSALELVRLRKELAAAREELEETRHELSEAQEAKDASETCVAVLRAYIATTGAGEGQVPDATPKAVPAPPSASEEKKQGWSFKMWRTSSTASAASATAASPPEAPVSGATAPVLSQKLTGLFGPSAPPAERDRRSDVSSVEESEPLSPVSDVPPRAPAVMVRTPSMIAERDALVNNDANEHIKATSNVPDAPLVSVAL